MAPEQQPKDEAIDYTVLSYAYPKEGNKSPEPENHGTTTDQEKAMSQAEELFTSGQFKKVEVKKKYFEENTGRTINMVLRSYDNKPKLKIGVGAFLAMAALCGLLAFGLSYFIGKAINGG